MNIDKKNSKKIHNYILPFRVHTPNLLNETFINACRPRDLQALRIPLNQFKEYLVLLTKRCTQLNDPILNKIMVDMTMYEQSDPLSNEYNKDMVHKVNENYKEYIERQQVK